MNTHIFTRITFRASKQLQVTPNYRQRSYTTPNNDRMNEQQDTKKKKKKKKTTQGGWK